MDAAWGEEAGRWRIRGGRAGGADGGSTWRRCGQAREEAEVNGSAGARRWPVGLGLEPEEARLTVRSSRHWVEDGGQGRVAGEPAQGEVRRMAAGLAGGEGEEEGVEREGRLGGRREARSRGWPGKKVPAGRELGLG